MSANRSNNLRVEQGLYESDAEYLRRLRQIPNERFNTVLYQDKVEATIVIGRTKNRSLVFVYFWLLYI